MIKYKIDILEELKKKGYNPARIRKEKIIAEATLQQIRRGGLPGIKTLDTLCRVLKKQPGQLLEYVQDHEENQE